MKKILLSLLFALFLLPLAVMGQCGSGLSVIDADGNSYATVKVGSYCWMQSNLKTRVPGSSIYWADMYPDTSANLDIYGRLYNWYAAMNIQPGETPVVSDHGFVQGVCPNGWHLPTADEISQLATYSVPGLHDTHYWMVPGTNTTAYTMRPGGFYNASKNRSEDLCGSSYMWTAQSLNPLSPSIVWSDCYCDHFVVDESAAGNGLSVRCVLGVFQAEVKTYAATNVKSNQADLNGKVIFAGHDENYTRGFTYGTDMEHSTVDTAQTGQSEEGDYSFTIKDLAENTTYYFRAYVVNEFDTVYGEWKNFTTTYMKVETSGTDEITMHTTKVKGNVVSMGGYESLNAGFLYGTDRNALTGTAQHEQAILSLGNYSCNLNGLMPDTKYYYCAYLTNGRQTVYGDTLDFTTAHMAVVTAAATNVTNNSAKLNGTLTALRVYTNCVGKFRYGQREDMLNLYSGGSNMGVTGDFDNDIIDLSPNTTYYFQALAIHGTDTVSGEILSFTTPTVPCPGLARTNEHATEHGIDSVRDVEGNSYATVLIGSQCWMAQNLRTTKYADGTAIVKGSAMSRVMPYRYFPDNDTNNVATYGHLYNWKAVMNGADSSSANPSGVQGICPDGWHVPSNAEWNTLTQYVYNSDDPDYKCSSCESSSWIEATKCIGKALASATGWNSDTTTCNVGNDLSSNNATGFSAVPAGGIHASGKSAFFGQVTFFWSATYEAMPNKVHARNLYYNNGNVSSYGAYDSLGLSVRCLRDPLTVTTDSVKEVTNNDATLYGNVKSLGKYTTVNAGFRYGTSDSTMTTKVDQSVNTYGSYNININNLSPNTTYYFQAYAANEADTVYGEVKTFTTLTVPCPGAKRTNEHATSNGIDSVSDVEGNSYTTVLIGSQCWMAQNLRTTQYADGTAIEHGTDTSSVKAYRYFPDNDTNNVATYGHLYNWPAVMGSSASSNNIPSGVQGICPEGWHVPSDTEWTQLTDYVNSQSGYKCGGTDKNIAKALASATGWNTNTITCDVGNDLSSNNATGFSAVPAGYYGGSYDGFGDYAVFWTATQPNSNSINVYVRNLASSNAKVIRIGGNKGRGVSVRCLRDPLTATTDSVKEVTSKTATLYGNVKSLGKYTTVNAGFRYGTSDSTMTTKVDQQVNTYGSYLININNLSPNTTYYFQAYAANEADTAWAADTLNFATFTVTTDSAKATKNSATLYGSVKSLGSYASAKAGFRYGTSDSTMTTKVDQQVNTYGSYLININNLSPNTTYYFQAYAANEADTAWAADTLNFITLSVTTDSAKDVTTNSATIYGNVKSLGKYTTVKAGFRYGTSADALTNRTADTTMTANGILSVALTSLAPNNTYYFQAYACNGTDTVYGKVMDFKTASDKHCPDIYTITDHEGNMYNTVQIGSQCWLAENMRCTTSPNGSLQKGETDSSSPKYYTISNTTLTLRESGLLYNWYGALDTTCNTSYTNRRGICPEGWHVPTHEEWTQLTTYVNSVTDYKCGGQDDDIAKALASTTGWNSDTNTCAVGNDLSANNATGFNAVPVGGYNANFWSATQYSGKSDYAHCLSLYAAASNVHKHDAEKVNRYSVRCLRDPEALMVTVTFQPNGAMGTMESQSVTSGVATQLNANTYNRDNAPETDRNWAFIGWNTKADGTGVSFANQANVTFDSDTTLYAQWHTWCTGTPNNTSVNEFGTSRIDSLKDVDNNKYTVVQIGNQCWMKQNLRTTKYANNTSINQGSSTSSTTAYSYYPNKVSDNVSTYGYLYNWIAVMNDAASSEANPSGVQGICPTGWHVPSDLEWTQLTDYVKGKTEYQCGGSADTIANALSGGTWSSPSTCGAGHSSSATFNATGFSAVPAGYLGSNYYEFGRTAYFWSATLDQTGNAHTRNLYNSITVVIKRNYNKHYGYSVRCLRNPESSSPK